MTLLELLVAVSLGLLVIGIGLGTLLVSQQLSATTTDASVLQEQASYALRVIGQQVRQAGSIELDLAGDNPRLPAGLKLSFTGMDQVIEGSQDADGKSILMVAYQNYVEATTASNGSYPSNPNSAKTLFRNCLGEGGDGSSAYITSTFKYKPPSGDETTGALTCDTGAGNGAQQLVRNVADFQVRYLEQHDMLSNPTLTLKDAGDVGRWSNVVAVTVCLDMVGDERTPGTDSETYISCDDSDTPANMNGRMHSVFRNTFQIRSQGLVRSSQAS